MRRKFGEGWTCDSGYVLADRQTDRHAHHNAAFPTGGGAMMAL